MVFLESKFVNEKHFVILKSKLTFACMFSDEASEAKDRYLFKNYILSFYFFEIMREMLSVL